MPLKVKVKNFQSIAEAELEVNGFTVVTGSNNSGKTALMRAIRGVFQNTSGHRFVRHGEAKCEVTISDDKHSVTWEKGAKQKPKYTLDGKVMYPGRDVPTELSCMGVVPIRCSGTEIWPQLAPQFQQIFLLDENGSAIAEALADVERVGKLNRALKKSNTDRKQTAGELKVRNKDKIQHENELLVFEGLDDVISQFESIEQAHALLEVEEQKIQQVKTLIVQYNDALSEVEELQGIQSIDVPDRDVVVELAAMAKDCKRLRQMVDEYNEVTEELNQLGGAIDDVELPSKQAFVDINEARKEIQGLMDLQQEIEDAQSELDAISIELEQTKAEWQEAQADVKDLLREAKVCPTCGTKCGVHFLDQMGIGT